jgi:hypothetical protein
VKARYASRLGVSRGPPLLKGVRWPRGRRLSALYGRRVDRCNGRDESVPPSRNGLDELRSAGIVTKCLTELGDSLSQCIVGDVCSRPERVEQLLFGDQRAGVVEQVEQKVEKLGRQLNDGVVSHNAIPNPINKVRAESVAGTCHVPRLYAGISCKLALGAGSPVRILSPRQFF